MGDMKFLKINPCGIKTFRASRGFFVGVWAVNFCLFRVRFSLRGAPFRGTVIGQRGVEANGIPAA